MKTKFGPQIKYDRYGNPIRTVPIATFKTFCCILLIMAIIGGLAGVNTFNLMIEVGL
jgi:hypothetical protein